MKRAKIYKPTKTAMQSGDRNTKNWLLEFDTLNTGINPLMGWETSNDTMSEVKLEFSTKALAIEYALCPGFPVILTKEEQQIFNTMFINIYSTNIIPFIIGTFHQNSKITAYI